MYKDLVEERQHVMTALLETKCTPVGMELFPATSLEQLEVIKRVIDDSDYYLLLLAGRYGSAPPDSLLSFTEHEFDYALSRNKSILVFCHKEVESLPGFKLERGEVLHQKLTQFRQKALTGRTCTFWTTPTELESRVKSAILYAIEHDPQPGWVRLSDVQMENPRLDGQANDPLQKQLAELKTDLSRTRRTFAVDGPSTLCVTGKGLSDGKADAICQKFVEIGIINFASSFLGPEHIHYTFPVKTIIPGPFLENLAQELLLNIKVISSSSHPREN